MCDSGTEHVVPLDQLLLVLGSRKGRKHHTSSRLTPDRSDSGPRLERDTALRPYYSNTRQNRLDSDVFWFRILNLLQYNNGLA